MRVLVAWGSKLGGTEGIGRQLAEVLAAAGHDVLALPASAVRSLGGLDAVIVGGALYANRWHRDARRFVERHARALARVPVWFFSSGPLDASADGGALGPVPRVRALMERVGAQGHVTFGGRLEPDVEGFPARAMARTRSGDWRNPARIRAWADTVAAALPDARPRPTRSPPGRALARLVRHAVAAGLTCAALLVTLLALASTGTALLVHAIVAPLVVVPPAWAYFAPRGARQPAPVALAFTVATVVLEVAAQAGLGSRALAPLDRPGAWVAYALVALVVATVGAIASTLPWPTRAPTAGPGAPSPSRA